MKVTEGSSNCIYVGDLRRFSGASSWIKGQVVPKFVEGVTKSDSDGAPSTRLDSTQRKEQCIPAVSSRFFIWDGIYIKAQNPSYDPFDQMRLRRLVSFPKASHGNGHARCHQPSMATCMFFTTNHSLGTDDRPRNRGDISTTSLWHAKEIPGVTLHVGSAMYYTRA